MKKDKFLLAQRNRRICAMYFDLLRRGTPFMEAYAATAETFWLSESHIRRIIAHHAQQKARK